MYVVTIFIVLDFLKQWSVLCESIYHLTYILSSNSKHFSSNRTHSFVHPSRYDFLGVTLLFRSSGAHSSSGLGRLFSIILLTRYHISCLSWKTSVSLFFLFRQLLYLLVLFNTMRFSSITFLAFPFLLTFLAFDVIFNLPAFEILDF